MRASGRVIRAARLYLHEESAPAPVFRFDVVAVTFALDDSPPEIEHIEDAFQAGSG